MQHLSPERFQKAVTFIKEHGRPLEQALVAHEFEGEPIDTVLDVLARYQNPDGGFGHALEPDIRLPDSSVIATTVALQILRDRRVSPVHPLWHGAMQYLGKTYDPDKRLWWSVPPNVSDAPHAPWWNVADPGGGSLTLNPRAEIIGYLFDVSNGPEEVPDTLRQQLMEEVVREFEAREDNLERHEVLCGVRLVETENMPPEWQERLMRVLHNTLSFHISRRPEEWVGYVMTPLDVVVWQKSFFYPKYADLVPANLEVIMMQQQEAGYWTPAWSWSDGRVSWAEVENDWRSVITWQNLERLSKFDVIERG